MTIESKDFKRVLIDKEGRSLRWFHEKFIGKKMTLGAMYQQFNNGQSPKGILLIAMKKYLETLEENA